MYNEKIATSPRLLKESGGVTFFPSVWVWSNPLSIVMLILGRIDGNMFECFAVERKNLIHGCYLYKGKKHL